MADNDREKQLDRLLDSLLSQYSAAQPRPGLETRVLAQIAECCERKQAGSGWRRWLIGAGIAGSAVAVAIVMLVFRAEQGHSPTPSLANNTHTEQPQQSSKTVQVPPTIPATRRKVAAQHTVAHPKTEKKNREFETLAVSQRPAVFPTPVPLTEQERLMFSYVENTPQSEVVAQIKSEDQKEARAFWAQGEPLLKSKAR
ncbi:MAG TPA: hypothetical protein VFP59_01310 [Candidatus Angelobacter sp.]|nr:hypothetical protein [Candidatus Angelobacter sp.]